MTFNKKKILITGGLGFIASNLALKLAPFHKLILLDKNTSAEHCNISLRKIQGDIEIIKGDILNELLVETAVKDVDIIIHAAALLGVAQVMKDPLGTLETNLRGTQIILKAASSNKHLEQFIYISSSEVFGQQALNVNENSDLHLSDVNNPRWSYALSKLTSEHLCLGYFHKNNLPVTIIRPFNIFGPKRLGDHAILSMSINALVNEPLILNGSGKQIRSWCYIDDFLSGILAALNYQDAIGADFNLGDARNPINNIELAAIIVKLAESNSRIKYSESNHIDINMRIPDYSKATRVLGYLPRANFYNSLKSTIAWYREHLDDILALRNGRKPESNIELSLN